MFPSTKKGRPENSSVTGLSLSMMAQRTSSREMNFTSRMVAPPTS